MSNWYDREMKNLEEDLQEGHISQAEFKAAVRDLNAELRQEAEDNAEQAYRDTFGY